MHALCDVVQALRLERKRRVVTRVVGVEERGFGTVRKEKAGSELSSTH